MYTAQFLYKDDNWSTIKDQGVSNPDFILCFGQRETIEKNTYKSFLKYKFPDAPIVIASTAGEINNDHVSENSIVANAIEFSKESSKINFNCINLKDFEDSNSAGKALVSDMINEDLKLIILLSDGQLVNGSELVDGINSETLNKIPVTGGLAGDGPNFNKTLVGIDDNIQEGNVVAIGLYGHHLKVGFGSKGGWGQFGPERILTKSTKNVVEEIDDKKAVDLYRLYLGKDADDLVNKSFYFPISIKDESGENSIVRTILSIDEDKKTMTFAGNMPQGSKVRLMKFNTDKLLHASTEAMHQSVSELPCNNSLSIMITCIGRKVVLNRRVDNELEAAQDGWENPNAMFTGFYSYGEIAPFPGYIKCELHNQTMTITTITELD